MTPTEIVQAFVDLLTQSTTPVPSDPWLYGKAEWNPKGLQPGTSTLTKVTVNGATVGDFVMVSMSANIWDLNLTAHVSESNTVTAVLSSHRGGWIDLAPLTIYAAVKPRVTT